MKLFRHVIFAGIFAFALVATAAPIGQAAGGPATFARAVSSSAVANGVVYIGGDPVSRFDTGARPWIWQGRLRGIPGVTAAGPRVALSANGRTVIPDSYIQTNKLAASDGAAGDAFGWSVAVSSEGSTALVGAFCHGYDPSRIGRCGHGVAYAFSRKGSSYRQTTKLRASDATPSDVFGDKVALSANGGTALVGASNQTVKGMRAAGAAYVFSRNGSRYTQKAELTASDGDAGDEFGWSVALSTDGSIALVGAREFDGLGAAYVFTRKGSSYRQTAELTAPDGTVQDEFGDSVALSGKGSTALVGASGHTVKGNLGAGAVYIFSRNGSRYTRTAELPDPDMAEGDRFGESVGLSTNGNTALVGAAGHTVNGNSGGGAAYIFSRGGSRYTRRAELTAPDGTRFDQFGSSLALSGDGGTALVGAACHAFNPSTGTCGPGLAYVFSRNGSRYTKEAELSAAGGHAGDQFGNSVALNASGNIALAGAPYQAVQGKSDEGAAYVFRRPNGGGNASAQLVGPRSAGIGR
jgi:FG-GAP repeat